MRWVGLGCASSTLLVTLLLVAVSSVCAQVVYVDCNAPGPEHDGTSWDTAFLGIQEGVDAGTPGGEAWVADGTYIENIVMGEGVAIYGGFLGAEEGGYETELDQRNWVDNIATIDGNQSGSCVVMVIDARVDGFTITNGSGTEWSGDTYGGGIRCHSLGPTGVIANNVITGNGEAWNGGGISCCAGSSPTVTNNVIFGNRVTRDGGGIYIEASSSPTITNNAIHGNWGEQQGPRGGGIYSHGSSPTIANNIITCNSAATGGGIQCDESSPTLSHNDVWNNSGGDYEGCDPGEGDISEDPLFEDPDAGDFHITEDSPCIDAGDSGAPGLPEYDFEGEPRLMDGDGDTVAVADIGADEFGDVVARIDLPEGDVIILEGSPVDFAGTAYDPKGQSIVDYLWTFGEGSGIPDSREEDPGQVVFEITGVFEVTFSAQAEDSRWDPTPDQRTVWVRPVVYVDCNAPGPEHDGTSWDTAFLGIQEGVDAGTPGGQVWVADGTYVENVVMGEVVAIYGGFLGAEPGGYETELEQRDFLNNVATIDGNQYGNCVGMAPDTRVDGFTVTEGGRGFYCKGLGERGAIIANNTIVNNGASSVNGGGIYCGSSSLTIVSNTITGNEAAEGGGIYCVSSSTVVNNTITDNYAGGGGGIYCSSGTFAIVGNVISYNSAGYGGGGIACGSNSSTTVAYNTIVGNWSIHDDADTYGGGIYFKSWTEATVIDNTIAENTADHGGGVYGGNHWGTLTITDNSITDNWAVGTGGGWNTGEGGGIRCFGSSCTVARNVITGNTTYRYGGGVYFGGSSAQFPQSTLTDNVIARNLSMGKGGGIACEEGSSPVISSNVVVDNLAEFSGGGLCFRSYSNPLVIGNIICGNTVDDIYGDGPLYGGGIACWTAEPVLNNNIISANLVTKGFGGGIACVGGTPTIINNTITGNTAAGWLVGYGGGIYSGGSYASLRGGNNIITENMANEGGGIYRDSGSFYFNHNDVWGNQPNDYYGCAGPADISVDPLFANLSRGDFHLTETSLCINAGWDGYELPEYDWDGEDRIVGENVDIGADEYLTHYTEAPTPQPECDGPLFGEPQAGFPGWVWFSIPMTPAESADPNDVLGFACNGKLHRYDKYIKAPVAYQPPFSEWDLAVGNSYILWLDGEVTNPAYEGLSPFTPWEFEFKLGRQGWTWVGMPGMTELGAEDFMASVKVEYPSDETGVDRTAQEDYDAIPENWITWGWPYWNTWLQAPETFTPYAPFGHTTCYPWVGYRVWVKVGTAQSEDDPDQATLIWPEP